MKNNLLFCLLNLFSHICQDGILLVLERLWYMIQMTSEGLQCLSSSPCSVFLTTAVSGPVTHNQYFNDCASVRISEVPTYPFILIYERETG
ncbi:hypothetical protein FKM82_021118 [Ascaphus truei]